MSRQSWQTAAAVVALLLVMAWGQRQGTPATARDAETQSQEVCVAVNSVKLQLRAYILQQIARSEKTIPTLEYYKNRPVELGRALANIETQRRQTNDAFVETPC